MLLLAGALAGCAGLLSLQDLGYDAGTAEQDASDAATAGDGSLEATADGAPDAAFDAPAGDTASDAPFACPRSDGGELPFCTDFDHDPYEVGWTKIENAADADVFLWPDASVSPPYSLMFTTGPRNTSQVDLLHDFKGPAAPRRFALAFDAWFESVGTDSIEMVHVTFGPSRPYFQLQLILYGGGVGLRIDLYDGTTKGYPAGSQVLLVSPRAWRHVELTGDLVQPDLVLSVDGLKSSIDLSTDAGVPVMRLPPHLSIGVPHLNLRDGGSDYRIAYDNVQFDCQ